MCEDLLFENAKGPVWDRGALDHLRSGLCPDSDDFGRLLAEEEACPAFDPIKVRDLLRVQKEEGREPELLILGRVEMASFRHFVSRGFGEESGSPLGGLFFLGIPVVGDVTPTRLEFVVEEDCSTDDPSGWHAA